MKAYEGVEVWLHSLFTLALDGSEWSTSSPGRFSSVKELQCPFNRKLGDSQCQFGHFEERKKFIAPAGIQTLYQPPHSSVLIPTNYNHIKAWSDFLDTAFMRICFLTLNNIELLQSTSITF